MALVPVRSFLQVTAPSAEALAKIAVAAESQPLSYPYAGATLTSPPEGWPVGGREVALGVGEDTWQRARDAVAHWRMFDLPWVRMGPQPPPTPGHTLAFASKQLGLWAINECRVVYVVDDVDGEVHRYGFGYGTLASHGVRGEERFLATWDRRTDRVSFEIFKFSRLAHPLVRAVAPYARAVQRQFDRDATAALARAVRS